MTRIIGIGMIMLVGAFLGIGIFAVGWGLSLLTNGQVHIPEWCEPLIWLAMMGLVVLAGKVAKPNRGAIHHSGVSAGD